MCLRCDGMTAEEVRQQQLADIGRHGWTVVAVEAGDGVPSFGYTVGLTRYHGHPELVVSGLWPEPTAELLDELGALVRGGAVLTAGGSVETEDDERYQLLRVSDPRRLVVAQEIYASTAGPVPALQVAWTNDDGFWPWEPAWTTRRREQQLFGRPKRW